MELTDNAKKDFEKWIFETYWKKTRLKEEISIKNKLEKFELLIFYSKNNSEKHGVYVDFFESVGIYISDMVNCYHSSRNKPTFSTSGFSVCIEGNGFCYDLDDFKTRPKARIEAIKKANEIYNLKK